MVNRWVVVYRVMLTKLVISRLFVLIASLGTVPDGEVLDGVPTFTPSGNGGETETEETSATRVHLSWHTRAGKYPREGSQSVAGGGFRHDP